jgi:hypothetical protein
MQVEQNKHSGGGGVVTQSRCVYQTNVGRSRSEKQNTIYLLLHVSAGCTAVTQKVLNWGRNSNNKIFSYNLVAIPNI